MTMEFDKELIQKVLDNSYTPEDVTNLARKYANAYSYAERVDMERALVEVEMNELRMNLHNQAERILKLYNETAS